MSEKYTFRAIIENAGGGGAFVSVPFDVEKLFGKKRVKVKASIDGIGYRGSLVRMGSECHILGVLKEIREQLKKAIGDSVEVSIEEDTEERTVTMPEDLSKELEVNYKAAEFFKQLSYTNQKECVRWIESAKRETTRLNRLKKAIELLETGNATFH